MKIEIEGVEVFGSRYDRWDDLIDDYARAEAEHGRVVPSYALEILVVAIALWVLEKAADRAVDWMLERKQNQREEQERQEQMERLEALERTLSEVRSQGAKIASDQEAILRVFRDVQARISVSPETEVERDLARALEDKLRGVAPVVVCST